MPSPELIDSFMGLRNISDKTLGMMLEVSGIDIEDPSVSDKDVLEGLALFISEGRTYASAGHASYTLGREGWRNFIDGLDVKGIADKYATTETRVKGRLAVGFNTLTVTLKNRGYVYEGDFDAILSSLSNFTEEWQASYRR